MQISPSPGHDINKLSPKDPYLRSLVHEGRRRHLEEFFGSDAAARPGRAHSESIASRSKDVSVDRLCQLFGDGLSDN